MAKKKIKIKAPKSKAGKILAGVLACIVIIFAHFKTSSQFYDFIFIQSHNTPC